MRNITIALKMTGIWDYNSAQVYERLMDLDEQLMNLDETFENKFIDMLPLSELSKLDVDFGVMDIDSEQVDADVWNILSIVDTAEVDVIIRELCL